MQMVSMDFRWVSILGLLEFSGAGYLGAKWFQGKYFPYLLFLILPIVGLFFFEIIPQLPSLTFLPFGFFAFSVLGFYAKSRAFDKIKTSLYLAVPLIIASFIQIQLIPRLVSGALQVPFRKQHQNLVLWIWRGKLLLKWT